MNVFVFVFVFVVMNIVYGRRSLKFGNQKDREAKSSPIRNCKAKESGAVAVAVLEDLQDEGLREMEVEVGRFGSLDLRETVVGFGKDAATDGVRRFDEEEGKSLGVEGGCSG
ncbi:hypothetical protein QYF36_001931 [Acer negundo]|nr:hypothetical protein QYF36_001931 [Acer negundo]